MIRATSRRLGALFLLTAFLAGGYGLSDLDAFIFHSSSHEVATGQVTHLDQPGGCGAHSERCVLALSTANVQQAGSGPTTVRLAPDVFQPRASAPVLRTRPSNSLHHSRAPPRAS